MALTDAQFTSLMDAAAQLHRIDRDLFLRAVAERFAGCHDIGDGEFARGLRELTVAVPGAIYEVTERFAGIGSWPERAATFPVPFQSRERFRADLMGR
jgi:hypothetical protein